MHRYPFLVLPSLLVACLGMAQLPGQKAPLAQLDKKLDVDSSWLANATSAEKVVFTHVVRFQGAPWMRLFFDKTNLPTGSFLKLTATQDGTFLRLDAHSIIDYGYASCFLRGDAVRVELIAGPNTTGNRVLITSATIGVGAAETICGPTDDRKESFDKRGGRFNGGCSGWLFGVDAIGSAGHCGNPSSSMIVEFNVPRSTSGGSKVPSHPDDQYPTVRNTGGRLASGVGNDWLVTKVGKNSNTGKLPGEAQGSWDRLGSVPTSTSGNNIRITGYGTSSVRILNQVQKTHVGPLFAVSGTYLRYRADTTGGNSGSPVIHENTGHVVGVHTHGGCSSSGTNSANHGTRIDRSDFQSAIKGLIGRAGSVTPYGAGCRGTAGTPGLSVTGTPNLGSTVQIVTRGLSPNAKGLHLVGVRQVNIDLTNLGLPGCFQLTSANIILALGSNGAGVAQLAATIPNDTCLVGVDAFLQHAGDDPTRNSTVVSNGVKVTVGHR